MLPNSTPWRTPPVGYTSSHRVYKGFTDTRQPQKGVGEGYDPLGEEMLNLERGTSSALSPWKGDHAVCSTIPAGDLRVVDLTEETKTHNGICTFRTVHTDPLSPATSMLAFSTGSNELLATAHDDSINVWKWDDLTAQSENRVDPVATLRRDSRFSQLVSPVSIEWDHTSNTLFSGHRDGHIMGWDLRSQVEKTSCQAHKGIVTDLQYLPWQTSIASSGVDGDVRLWDIRKQSSKSVHHFNKSISALNSDVEGTFLIAGTSDGTLSSIQVVTERLIGTNQATATVPSGRSPVRYAISALRKTGPTKFVSNGVENSLQYWKLQDGVPAVDGLAHSNFDFVTSLSTVFFKAYENTTGGVLSFGSACYADFYTSGNRPSLKINLH